MKLSRTPTSRPYLISALLGLTLSLAGCFSSTYEADFNALSEKAKNGGGSGDCLEGTWVTTICGTRKLEYQFRGGNGYSAADDCNGICTTPLIFRFTYTVSGNTVNYRFTSTDRVTCNGSSIPGPTVPTQPNSLTYTCGSGGNELTTVASNISTGVKTTFVFRRK